MLILDFYQFFLTRVSSGVIIEKLAHYNIIWVEQIGRCFVEVECLWSCVLEVILFSRASVMNILVLAVSLVPRNFGSNNCAV